MSPCHAVLRVLTFPPSQHTCGMKGGSPCLHLLIPENPCSTGTSPDVGFSWDSTSLLPIPGFVQFRWLRVGSPRRGWHGPVLPGYPILGSLCAKGSWQGVFPRTLPHSLGPNSFPGMSPELAGGKVASPAAPASHLSLLQVQGILSSSCPGAKRNS